MKDVVFMLIAQSQTLLLYHQAIMQQYKDTMEGLIRIADAYPELSCHQQDLPDFLPRDQEKALVRHVFSCRRAGLCFTKKERGHLLN